ncbi:MAG: hypothetical protein J2O48_06530 [Solirubrobacterales bacterium]|nr:hypothetical protein [Solirubrobacterales bacterium]
MGWNQGRSITAGLAVAAVLAGCGGSAKTVTVNNSAASSSGTTASSTSTSGSSGSTAGSGTTTSADSTKPLASRKVKDGNKTYTVSVQSLQVEGHLMTLHVGLGFEDPGDESFDNASLYDAMGGSYDVTLIDPFNLKEYLPVQDAAGNDLSDSANEVLANVGGSTSAKYIFAAPPATVSKVTVQMGNLTFADIPIQR